MVENERKRQDKHDTPSWLTIDSQSVKKVQFTDEQIGVDGSTNVNGRKRTIIVDSLLPWSIKAPTANVSDNQAGILAIDWLNGKVPRLKKITADAGYKLAFKEDVETNYALGKLKSCRSPNRPQDLFHKRKVARSKSDRRCGSFGCLNFRRRLFRDVGKTILSSEAMIQMTLVFLIINCGAGFSLEIPLGIRFVVKSRLFTEEEANVLNSAE